MTTSIVRPLDLDALHLYQGSHNGPLIDIDSPYVRTDELLEVLEGAP